ncbi:hypothetical protein CFIMG_008530RA00001 [Ceratocystis fimbriata CBS 114723]|uniref:Uncharacterized protein n=1 Tax=Ceratocystis fimbriata CBS 114723 TaxID=1035309 RepID=A0A2C5XH00_9PEZI|nr:hypothetical protein CFIMG_008530RA00001 [Ceratocystis fimbriata CBS 114723]
MPAGGVGRIRQPAKVEKELQALRKGVSHSATVGSVASGCTEDKQAQHQARAEALEPDLSGLGSSGYWIAPSAENGPSASLNSTPL